MPSAQVWEGLAEENPDPGKLLDFENMSSEDQVSLRGHIFPLWFERPLKSGSKIIFWNLIDIWNPGDWVPPCALWGAIKTESWKREPPEQGKETVHMFHFRILLEDDWYLSDYILRNKVRAVHILRGLTLLKDISNNFFSGAGHLCPGTDGGLATAAG